MKNGNLMWLEEKQNSNKKGKLFFTVFLITILYMVFYTKVELVALILFIPLTYGLLYLNDVYMRFFCETTEVILALPFTIKEIVSSKNILLYKKIFISSLISFLSIILFRIIITRSFILVSVIDIISALVISLFLLVLIPFYGLFFFNFGIRKRNLINFMFIILIFLTSIFISLKLYYIVLILYLIASVIMILYKKTFLHDLSKEKIFREV